MKPNASPQARVTSPRHGFNLIEVVVVLAAMAILAAAALPVLTAQWDDRARLKEEEYLKGIAAAVESYTLRTRSIPSAATFATAIAPEMGTTSSKLLVNERGRSRVVLIDNALRIGTNASSVLPYTQTIAGSLKPVSPRMMVVSSVGVDLPTSLTNGVLATNLFSAIWDTPPRQVPSGWTWSGSGEDLKIQRIQLNDLFVQLALNAQGNTFGSYSIDNSAPVAMSGTPKSIWVIKSSRLAMIQADGTTQVVLVLKDSLPFVSDNGVWRSGGGAQGGWTGDDLIGSDLGQAASAFLAAPANPSATTTQTALVTALQNYLAKYSDFASSSYSNLTKSNAVVAARATLEATMDALTQ